MTPNAQYDVWELESGSDQRIRSLCKRLTVDKVVFYVCVTGHTTAACFYCDSLPNIS